MSEVEREAVLPAPPDEVWDSLVDPDRLSEWFGAGVEGDVAPDEVLTFTFPDGTQRRGLVEIADPDERLVFRWLPHGRAPDGEESRRESSRVAIHLEPYDGNTIIRITETRVGSAGSPRPQIGFRPQARTAV